MQPIMEAVRRGGAGFSLDASAHEKLAGLGLTEPQIAAVVRLAKEMADKPAGASASPNGAIRDRTALALAELGILPERIPEVLDLLPSIATEMNREGGRFRLHPSIAGRLAELGLSETQIDAVIELVGKTTKRSPE